MRRLFVIAVLSGVVATSAQAQRVPNVRQAEARKDKPRLFTADLGFVKTGGNTDLTTLNASEKIAFERMGWGFEQYFGAIYGKDSSEVTTSLWRSGLKGERFLTSELSAVLGVAWDRNRFAGIDGRFEEFIGLKYRWHTTRTNTFFTELAASMVQQDNTDSTTDNFPAARLGAGYRHNFSSRAYFQDAFEYIPNLEETTDYRINNEAAFVAPLSTFVAIKLSYIIRFDNLPPTDFKKSDTFFTSGLQIAF